MRIQIRIRICLAMGRRIRCEGQGARYEGGEVRNIGGEMREKRRAISDKVWGRRGEEGVMREEG